MQRPSQAADGPSSCIVPHLKLKAPQTSIDNCKKQPQCLEGPTGPAPANSSSGGTAEVNGPGTPKASSGGMPRRVTQHRRSSSEDGTDRLLAPHPQPDTGSTHSSSASTGSCEGTQSRLGGRSSSHRPPACQPSLSTRIRRHIAWSAQVLRRTTSCPADMAAGNSSSSSSSSTGTRGLHNTSSTSSRAVVAERVMQAAGLHWAAAGTRGGVSSSNPQAAASMRVGVQAAQTAIQQQAAQPQPPQQYQQNSGEGLQHSGCQQQPILAAAAEARAFSSQPSMSVPQPHSPCVEITPCDVSTDGDSRQHSPRQDCAESVNSLSSSSDGSGSGRNRPRIQSSSYPECLFGESAVFHSRSGSFSSKVYLSSTGQRVAIVRVGPAITAVFVKEQSGEVWEASPDQITFPGGCDTNSSRNSSGGGGSCKQPVQAGPAAPSTLRAAEPCMTAQAAHRLFCTLNKSSSGSGGGSFARGSSCSGSWHGGLSADGSGSSGGNSAEAHAGCSSSSKLGRQSLLSRLCSYLGGWRRRRLAGRQRERAALVEELDAAAHQAMRLAGCESFVLPRHWSEAARLQAQEQRRLRVLLAAYRT